MHKASHHFDLLNWWLDSEPEEVFAYGSLGFLWEKQLITGILTAAPCPYKKDCKFYWDINKNQWLVDFYVKNQSYDGYLRDGCVWREDIDIFDKMAVQIKYANKVQVSYSLTAYSPYEGYRIALMEPRQVRSMDQRALPWEEDHFDEIHLTT